MLILIFIIIGLSFGVICSPYMVCRSVKQLAIDHAESHPLAAEVANEEIYMDDVCSESHSLPEVIAKLKQTYEVFALGCFSLRNRI